MQDATEVWADCISAQGYDYASPDDMRQHFYSAMINPEADRQELFQLEVQTSIANLSCEPEYRSVYQDLVIERFDEFLAFLDGPMPPGDGANG